MSLLPHKGMTLAICWGVKTEETPGAISLQCGEDLVSLRSCTQKGWTIVGGVMALHTWGSRNGSVLHTTQCLQSVD